MIPGADMARRLARWSLLERCTDFAGVGCVRHILGLPHYKYREAFCFSLFFFTTILYANPLFAAANGDAPAEPLDLFSEGLEVVGYLLLLMVFAGVVVRLGKHFQPRMGAGGLIQIEDGHNLAPGVGVRLVRIGSRAWLLGVTRERVSLLAEISEDEIRRPAKEEAS